MLKKVLLIIGIILLFIIFLGCFGYYYGSRHFVVNEKTLYFDDLPEEFDGYRIAQFSDFHAMAFHLGHENDVPKVVKLINSQKCNLIVFTGDIVTVRANELDGFQQYLSHLSATDGVISIMGNHDYAMYKRDFTPTQRFADIKDLHRRQQKMGWKLLLNDHTVIKLGKDSIVVVGVENDGIPPHFPSFGNLSQATKGINDGAFKILLSHDPTHWRRKVIPGTNIQLTLSGHTHAGQFKIFGWSPISLVYNEWSGIYTNIKKDKSGKTITQILNVSEGIGCVPVSFRIGSWPELNVITLKHKK